jgi:hypothetical protein
VTPTAAKKVYVIEETAEMLSLSIEEVHRLANEGLLSKRTAITAESIVDFAARKKIVIVTES